MIGGAQGSGINASAEIFAKALMRGGLSVFANIEFHSNIMGKHSYYRVTASTEAIRSHTDPVDLLVALDRETGRHWCGRPGGFGRGSELPTEWASRIGRIHAVGARPDAVL